MYPSVCAFCDSQFVVIESCLELWLQENKRTVGGCESEEWVCFVFCFSFDPLSAKKKKTFWW